MKHVLFLLIPVLFLQVAHAEDLKPAARALRTRGLRAYDIQRYSEAIDAFRSAYEIDPQPDLIYALAQAERMNGDCRRAIDAYRAFLRSHPPQQQAASAKKNLGRCETQLPPPASTPLPPSPAPLLAVSPSLADASPLPPSHRSAAHDTAGHVLLALGAAGLVTGGALWGVAQGEIDAANGAGRYDQFAADHAAAAHAEGERIGGIAAVAVGGALALAAAIHYGVWVRGR